VLDRETLLKHFSLYSAVDYHRESLQRTAHIDQSRLRRAAVLIGFVERETGLHVIFTRRAAHLKHHPGQVSFPGGKFEPNDQNIIHTAIREMEEEVGISADKIDVFGQLEPLTTVSQFSILPVLAFIKNDYHANIDSNEVAELFEVPAHYLFHPNNLISHTFRMKDNHHRIFAVSYDKHFIWGATAQIIQSLQRHLSLY
jgi:8-oxo-dGTP pyrophosphatase MutT (NUDIX family)